MDSSAKEFLSDAIDDYNAGFKTPACFLLRWS
jgi:HEPN domain-containing protein